MPAPAPNGELIPLPRSAHVILLEMGFRVGTEFQPRYGGKQTQALEPVYVKQAGTTAIVIIGEWAQAGRSPTLRDACVLHVWHWPGRGRAEVVFDLRFPTLKDLIGHLPEHAAVEVR
jgi:hypothetical protein